MFGKYILPGIDGGLISGVPETSEEELFYPEELKAIAGGLVRPHHWAVACGRLRRSWLTGAEIRKAVRAACAEMQEEVGVIRLVCGWIEIQRDEIAVSLDRLAEDDNAAWEILRARDDLESMFVVLSQINLAFPTEESGVIHDAYAWSMGELSHMDNWVVRRAAEIRLACRRCPSHPARKRIAAIGSTMPGEWWLGIARDQR